MDKNQLLLDLKQAKISGNLADWSVLSDKAVSEFPNEAFGHFYKGDYLLTINDNNAAISFLTKAVQLDSKSGEYQFALGFAKLQLNEDSEAKTIFEKLLETDTENTDLYYSLALCYIDENETKALGYLNKALDINPNHINSLDLRVYFSLNQNRNKDALADLNRLINLRPHSSAWRFQRIEILKKEEGRVAVEDDFRFLIDNNPNQIDFRISLGDYYLEIGAYSDAVYAYSDAIDIEKRAGIINFYSYVRRANTLLRKGDFYKAIDDFKFVIKSDAEDPDAYLGIADAYLAIGQTETALNYLDIGLDIVYDSRWRLYEKQGDIALKIKDYDLAEASFKGMTSDIQGKAEGYYQLGALYLRQGDLEMAYKALKESEANLHDLAEEMIETHLKQYLISDQRIAEKELQSDYSDEIENNAKSTVLANAFGKLWKLDEKTTIDKNSVLTKLPSEMKSQIIEAFKGMLFKISPSGLLIFNFEQEDTRAVYSIISESEDKTQIEILQFGLNETKELSLICNEKRLAICGIGTEKAAFDLYFGSCNFVELPNKIQQNYKEKEAAGNFEFLV